MGRSAGHLALGIGKATGATLTIIPEEFRGPVHLERSAISLRSNSETKVSMEPHADGGCRGCRGVARTGSAEELSDIEGVRITHDSYGHLRLAELDLAVHP